MHQHRKPTTIHTHIVSILWVKVFFSSPLAACCLVVVVVVAHMTFSFFIPKTAAIGGKHASLSRESWPFYWSTSKSKGKVDMSYTTSSTSWVTWTKLDRFSMDQKGLGCGSFFFWVPTYAQLNHCHFGKPGSICAVAGSMFPTTHTDTLHLPAYLSIPYFFSQNLGTQCRSNDTLSRKISHPGDMHFFFFRLWLVFSPLFRSLGNFNFNLRVRESVTL